ncbi:MAG: hypothetical protein LBS86_07720 [Treponema sp.]|jgi:hypothetical protein|nr:hypothetical protein [Treponema sp.]
MKYSIDDVEINTVLLCDSVENLSKRFGIPDTTVKEIIRDSNLVPDLTIQTRTRNVELYPTSKFEEALQKSGKKR